jgi:hypothetical protein
MKNKYKLILLIITFSFYSCKQNENDYHNNQSESTNNSQNESNESSNFDASNIKVPDENQIKNDLLGNTLGDWSFKKLEEFESVDIVESQILNNNTLQLRLELDLTDYYTHDNWDGEVTLSYGLQNDSQWHFQNVTGTLDNLDANNTTPRITRTIYHNPN